MRWRRRAVDPETGRSRVEELLEGRIGPEVYPQFDELIQKGVDAQDLMDALTPAIESSAEQIAATLHRTAGRMLKEHRRLDRRFRRDVRFVWGDALDLLYQVYVCAEELGYNLERIGRTSDWDAVSEALYALQARACLVTKEVHHLLSAGYPMAASARARTLHETAVIASLISRFAGEELNDDLAQRFLDHWIVDVVRDYDVAIQAGLEVDSEELAKLTAQRDDVVMKYGPLFRRDYGWAACLFPDLHPTRGRVRFDRLVQKAEAGLSKLDYRLQSHQVHASSLTLELHKYNRAGRSYRLTGATNTGFVEPAVATLTALVAATNALVHDIFPTRPDPMDFVALATIRRLVDDAIRAFEVGADEYDRTMKDWLRRQSRRKGKRMLAPTTGHFPRLKKWCSRRRRG